MAHNADVFDSAISEIQKASEMRNQRRSMMSIGALLLCVSPGFCQCNDNPTVDPDPVITIVDGAITLNGTLKGLAGIEAKSEGGYLSLDSIEIVGGDRLYFRERARASCWLDGLFRVSRVTAPAVWSSRHRPAPRQIVLEIASE